MATKEASGHADLVVIGAGPGGYAAAFLAADLGMDVTLVYGDPKPGGVCLHRGCIPSKALLHVAQLINETREAKNWGVDFGEPSIDIDVMRKWKESIIDKLAGGIGALGKQRGVRLINGFAKFHDSQTLDIAGPDGDQQLTFKHAIVATGSSPVMPGIFDIGDDRVLDSTTALDIESIPERLLVVGGGYIGLEMGTVYAALGSDVTVVEFLDRLLAGADKDLVRPLEKKLASKFAAIHLETKVAALTASKAGITAELDGEVDDPKPVFDAVLVAVGRRPNSQNLGLEATGVVVDDKGFIGVDQQQRTADPHILAIGDVAGEPMLAHKAAREARVAVEALAGQPAEYDNVVVPAVVFTDPEVAWCGLTEAEAKAEKTDVEIARFPWSASGRATALGRNEGLTKLIVEPKTERILGVGIVGPGAGELIAEAALAVEMGCAARDLGDTIHAHPTLAETLMEAAHVLHGTATHTYVKKK